MNAVITGSTKGIGRAVLLALAREGWNVAATSRNLEDLEALQDEVTQGYPGQECLIHWVDFAEKEETIKYGEDILAIWPEIDLLINNAGVFLPGSVHGEDDGALESTMALNLYSPYYLTRTLLPGMMNRKQGHIINMCSIASFMSYPNGGSYTISKFAMLGFSKALREEMKPHGIKVTSIMPGATWSASWGNAPYAPDRLMPAEDVAEAVLACTRMGPSSVVEEIIIRPQLGDL
ncbi:MAG: SDR family oxidoreductase [Saprospiraceae bacterium]|nr:SDR family oxidoreductase [Candidatus Opimibacter iunctus]